MCEIVCLCARISVHIEKCKVHCGRTRDRFITSRVDRSDGGYIMTKTGQAKAVQSPRCRLVS